MKPLLLSLVSICFSVVFSCSSDPALLQESSTQAFYFPPLNSHTWETKSIVELNWNADELEPLLDFLEEKESKSFIILHEGKIIVEAYFNGHTNTAPWYWASAGKTLTTAITGIAQEEGLLDINDKVSDYIGSNWTSAPLAKENLITCKHLLTMTSGLNAGLGDNIDASNLQYLTDAEERWAYHNVHARLQNVVAQASNQSWSNYFNSNLKDPIGMTGAWIQNNDFNVYWSTTRSMARFGLLISAHGAWENQQIIPENYLNDALNTSQHLNKAYGYLWWLNGKSNYRLPQTQLEFNGALIPNAPSDMYAALGKNDQKIYVVPSKNLVVIRMGNAAEGEHFAPSSFDNQLWLYINALID